MKRIFTAVLLLAGLSASRLLAHVDSRPASGGADWWTLWSADPLIVASLAWLTAMYAAGFFQLRAVRGDRSPVRRAHAVAFGAGMLCLIVALLSPVDALALELLSVHMVQHMILMNLAAPLVVLGAPARTMLWAVPPRWRQQVGRGKRQLERRGISRYLLWQPLLLWTIYAAVLWVWHLPRFYEAALQVEWVHDLQHVMFFATSCVFWRVLFDPIGRLQMSHALAVIYLFGTSLHATLLGVFMALAPRLWYPTYGDRAPAWGLAALEDQQLAGYIMWMPACMMYALIAAIVFARWLSDGNSPRQGKPVRAG